MFTTDDVGSRILNGEVVELSLAEKKAIVDEWNANLLIKTFAPLSAWQVRKVLTQFGLREQVESAVAQADQTTKDAWEYAKEFERDNPVLLGMAQMLGLTDEQLDTMFEIGIKL